uniref:CCHC-type domain-containing protein n=1 Tax=Oncorhynchus kisutch TaxID=8019 RepID=A0A8C7IWX9_ONCKI
MAMWRTCSSDAKKRTSAILLAEMVLNPSTRSVPGIGLANTIRFAWKEKELEPLGRETFGRIILMGILKLMVKDVFCFQGNSLEGAYDVALYTEEKHDDILRRARAVGGERPMSHYEITSLAKNNFRVVTVNIYNPYVKDEEVRAFLGRYMDNVSSARHLKDSLGFWNGRRGFQALLREDPKGHGGYLHPPAMFSLGADRGTLFYVLCPFCRRCMAYGHIFASYSTRKCRFCGSEEHEARDCDKPKACHGCGSSAHLWRGCPARQRSYAAAAGGGAGAGDGGRRGEGSKPHDQSTGPEGKAARKEEEQEAADGREKETEGTGVGEPGKAAEEGNRVEEHEREESEGGVLEKETVEEQVDWGESALVEEEGYGGGAGGGGGGGGISPLPPSPKKRMKMADSEREGMAKRVMGVGETSGLLLVSPGPQLLLGGDTPNKTQDWVQEEVGIFLFGDSASPIFFFSNPAAALGRGRIVGVDPGCRAPRSQTLFLHPGLVRWRKRGGFREYGWCFHR